MFEIAYLKGFLAYTGAKPVMSYFECLDGEKTAYTGAKPVMSSFSQVIWF